MELISIKQVSLDYGISRQMLYYYEEFGLIKSSRKENSSYRLYDETAVRRLQQIIVLRKLQIPVKQIKDILNNPNAVEIVEIFKQNINELDEQITALSTIKSILSRLVAELQEKADIHLKLDLLNDKTMISIVDSLSIPISRIKEKVSMNELTKASEHLRKQAEKSVSIVYRPPATMVEIKGDFGDIPSGDGKHKKIVEDMAKKFIEDTDLFKKKPDMRVFVRGHGKPGENQDTVWITIPDDMEVPPPYRKFRYPGGLYAASTDPTLDMWAWYESECNDSYHWDIDKRGDGWEYFNPFNIHGLSDYDYENDWACSYTTKLMPVREFMSDDEKKRINSALDKIIPCGEPIEIDLASMILEKIGDAICEVNYPNGFLELKSDSACMLTPQRFNTPIKIELRAKTDKENLYFGCTERIQVSLNAMGSNALDITDETNGSWYYNFYKKCGVIPADEFMDIEFFLGMEGMAIRVDGDLRHYSSTYKYIEALKANPEHSLGAVWVGTGGGSTVMVQSLRVTKI
jgi:DNA-binding transcriptional MerR regulator